jgi:Leucine-rich repeat (LRR) protein
MKTKLLILLFLASLSIYAQTNLVPNGGFETWTNSTTLSNWTIANSVTQNTSSFIEGIKSAQLSITNNTLKPEIIAQVPMTAGTTYTVKFKYKYVSANYSGQHPISLNISKSGSATNISSSTFATNNNWTVKETTFTPDQNLSYDLSISLYTFDAEAFNVLIDDVQVYIQGTEQYTLIPNVNFENKLIALGIDSGVADGKVQTNSINKLTSLNVSSSSITDLTGIQDFVALNTLLCLDNQLTTLNVSKNTALSDLRCYSNALTSLDVSTNLSLTHLECDSNRLTALDISANLSLNHLECQGNSLTTLDVSKNVALTRLTCNSNQLTALDISKNVALIRLECGSNQLTALDVSKNVALTVFNCNTNKLLSLNLKNGKNTFLPNGNINLIGNPNLTCIVVDNTAYSNTNWANKKDTTAFFSPLDCSLVTKIPDGAFEDKLIALGIDTDGKNGLVITASIAAVTTLDVSNSSIADLTGIQAFTALTTLNCSGNLLKKLDVSKNTAFTTLNCSNNPTLICIQVADVAAAASWATTKDATASFNLDCTIYTLIPDAKFEDKLIALGIDKDGKNGKVATESIASLTILNVSNSSITNLTGIQDFKALTELYCFSNQLTTLDVSNNIALTHLSCNSNQLTSLDVSKNVSLTQFTCDTNQLTTLDVSKNVALVSFYCNSNKLLSLNLKNSKNILLTNSYLNLSSNPGLRCITVDDVAYSNTNWANKKDATAFFSPLDCSTVTQIPDAKFEDKLIALGIDNDGKNGVVVTANISAVTTLDVSSSSIADLTGLQAFTALTTLNCSGNVLKKLDLSKNTALATLNCANNPTLICIQVADVAVAASWATTKDAIASFNVDCTVYTLIPDAKFEDKLIALGIDKDGKNGKIATESIATLTSLSVSSSSITNLTGIQDFKALTALYCYSNQLTTLDVSKNLALTHLECDSNQLTALDISKNVALTFLESQSNQLTNLDVSKNTALVTLRCYSNKLTTLDISKNTALTELNCKTNELKSLNLKNGNNTNLTTIDLTINPSLSCIQVDNVAISETNWATKKDATASFSLDCAYSTAIPDPKFEDKLIALGIDTDGKNAKVLTASIQDLTSLDVSNAAIADLKGIEDFTALQSLSCNQNLLTKIDLSKNINLVSLNIANNQLTALNTTKNTKLQTIHCNDNLLRTLDLSKNTSLTEIYCPNNKLISLNLKNGNNKVNNGPSIKNFTNNPDLSCIQVDDVTYSNTNWAFYKDATANYSSDCAYSTLIPDTKFEDKLIALGIDKDGKNGKVLTESVQYLTYLDVSNSSIKDLTGIQDFTALTLLHSDSNQLASLDVSKNVALKNLYCRSNQLTSLDVSKNVNLTSLYCETNLLTSLDVSKNTALTNLGCYSNKLTSLDVSKNLVLSVLECSSNQLTNLDVSRNVALTRLISSNSSKLQTLNLKNGKNTLLTNSNISLSSSPNLYCILVDDVTYSTTNWATKKDAVAAFNSVECKALSLPVNNFTVEAKGETCTDSKNGEINITGTATYNYKASINNYFYSFTNNSLKVANLTPGTYTVSITIPGETFEQSFTVVIPKGATITGKSSVVSNKVSVEITEGTAPYTVFVNGVEQFETTDSNFTVDTKNGGLLQVKTAKACEGIYAKEIAGLVGVASAYPNPTSGSFEIELPTSKKDVVISLYTLNGQMISTKTYTVENGKAQLSLENQPAGIYVAKIELDTPDYLKIIKN